MVEFITMAPTSGDGQYVGVGNYNSQKIVGWTASAERIPTLEYIKRIAQAAEKGGFSTLLLPTGGNCLDPLVVASSLIHFTERIKLLFAVRPGFTAPALFARQYVTFDYWSGGRVRANFVTGGSPAEQASDGDFLDHDARYRRTKEFIQVFKRLLLEDGFDHEGEFYRLKNASLPLKQYHRPVPEIYFGGASEVAKKVAAEEADVYMMWGETPELTKERIDEMKALAAQHNRRLSYSVSFQVVLGETEEQAWANAEELISRADPNTIQLKDEESRHSDSVGMKRLHRLMQSSRDRQFRIGPNLWAGLTQVLSGNSIALVGTPDQVADRIVEYVQLGFDKVLLRGFPHLEVIEAVGREVIPRVRERLRQQQRQEKVAQ
ncbi:MAG: alkanesulfonate monooxygenase [Bacillaceae bacterium G1]|nr:MAG: alkanesulfonate monooxygenase [Bacillaceae bacterium G1]